MDEALRALVWRRPGRTCEYCLLPFGYTITPFEIDHIIPRKHGGKTLATNLAPEARAAYDAIPHADSIVIDPHKHGLQPYGCGCILFRDPAVGRLYCTTGNQYTGQAEKYIDSIIALEMNTGKPVWSYGGLGADVFVIGCKNCGPDYDFGTVPLTFKGPGGRKLIGAGEKSGWFHAVDAATGA